MSRPRPQLARPLPVQGGSLRCRHRGATPQWAEDEPEAEAPPLPTVQAWVSVGLGGPSKPTGF